MPTYKDIISKKFGKEIVFGAEDIVSRPLQVFSVSPAIDIALSGGIPEGSWVSFVGPPGCGKTSTALQLLSEIQKEKYHINGNPRKAFYLDVEHRLKPMNLSGIHGLNGKDLTVISSSPSKQLTAEDFLTILTYIIRDPENNGGIAIIDSTSALCPSSEVVEDVCGQIRSTQPRIMASFCRQMAGVVRSARFTVVMIQHLITNTSGRGEILQTDGGEKVKYQLDVKLLTKGKPKTWGGDERKPDGQVIEWDVIKSALGQNGLSCRSYLRYGYGLDDEKEVCDIATELSVIRQSGAWYYIKVGDEERKYQGAEKVAEAIKADREVYHSILNQCKDLVGVKYES